MGKFLEANKLPRLNHEEVENLNTLITSKEIDPINSNNNNNNKKTKDKK